jgi:hypothetical protein
LKGLVTKEEEVEADEREGNGTECFDVGVRLYGRIYGLGKVDICTQNDVCVGGHRLRTTSGEWR